MSGSTIRNATYALAAPTAITVVEGTKVVEVSVLGTYVKVPEMEVADEVVIVVIEGTNVVDVVNLELDTVSVGAALTLGLSKSKE